MGVATIADLAVTMQCNVHRIFGSTCCISQTLWRSDKLRIGAVSKLGMGIGGAGVIPH